MKKTVYEAIECIDTEANKSVPNYMYFKMNSVENVHGKHIEQDEMCITFLRLLSIMLIKNSESKWLIFCTIL